MTLWVFGDSFSTPQEHMSGMQRSGGAPKFKPLDKTWTSIVSKNLTKNTEHQNFAIQGCSNEYIWTTLITQRPNIEKDDYVIVQLTSAYRKWFFEDRPHLANHFHTKFIPGRDASKVEIKAIDMYQRHLSAEFLNEYNYIMTVAAMQFVASQFIGKAKFLILPGFHPIHGVIGNLSDASGGEFDSEESRTTYYKKTSDARYNHFSDENHKILGGKVTKFFTHFEQVDLTNGFKQDIFNKDTVSNIVLPNLAGLF